MGTFGGSDLVVTHHCLINTDTWIEVTGMIFAPSSRSHHTHKNNLFFRFLFQTTYNKNRLFTFIFWASTLAPASKRRLITVVFPASTAQCNAVFLWYLSPRLTETLNVSSNRVGSTLEKKSFVRSTKEFNAFQLLANEFNFYTERSSITLCKSDIFVDGLNGSNSTPSKEQLQFFWIWKEFLPGYHATHLVHTSAIMSLNN